MIERFLRPFHLIWQWLVALIWGKPSEEEQVRAMQRDLDAIRPRRVPLEDVVVCTSERELTEAEDRYLNKFARCPVCGSGPILAGPCGGLAQNIMCVRCQTEIWYGAPFRSKIMTRSDSRISGVYGQTPLKVSKDGRLILDVPEDGESLLIVEKEEVKVEVEHAEVPVPKGEEDCNVS
jgi:hypothetical protein